ncbi:MAG TPA: hypothetical protein VGV61_06475 [Thermoanaerobaculia bacterium]|jgi:hypothetical protein|nr:hypothetical protein [Thermoanaerobaculia bacterium]
MRVFTIRGALASLGTVLLLGGCASSDIGDILGGPGGRGTSEIRGTVRYVDTRGDCRIDLDNASSSSYLNNGGSSGGYGSGGRTSVYCDSHTRVVYQGQTYRPESLEPGDVVVVDVNDVGGRPLADRIDVTYDVSSNRGSGSSGPNGSGNGNGSGYPQDDRYGTYGRAANEDLRGTVRRVDRENRMLTLERVQYYNDRGYDRGGGDLLTLYYDNDTRVTFRGQSYRPESLEAGDVVAVTVDQVRGTLIANDIQVLANARDSNASTYPR